ncbi:MAG TPA: aromatic amino acid lyase [Mesorhizobium sp.]|jgi:histidine ammonia-lyase|nr:aromatic amino acid lyase [Mesorhizobium sp.]
MTIFTLGGRAVTIEDVVTASRGGMHIQVTPEARGRMGQARAILDDHLARDIPVYGLNTGLGGNVGHRIAAEDAASLQAELVLARVAGVGPALPVEVCRAVLFCRLVGLARAGAGVSLQVFDLLADMLARDVIPVIPSHGSTGASDLVQTMSIAGAAIGEGEVWSAGRVVESADALRAAGLAPGRLAPKDGLSIGSASSVAAATAALCVAAVEDLIAISVATAALACQGFGASPDLFDHRVASARAGGMQVAAAGLFRNALKGTDFFGRSPVKVQDPLSFRALPQVTGAVLAAHAVTRREAEIELNAAADNPLVFLHEREISSSANFLAPSLALAFDTMAIVVTHLATASVQRSIKLMTGRLSGLAQYLSPVGGASAGFVPMQKSLAALHAEIRLKAAPASLDGIVVSDMVEDLATNTVLSIAKLEEQLVLLRWLISIEAMVAAQAVDLRRETEPSLLLGPVTGLVHSVVRVASPPLGRDRATGPDAAAVHERLWLPGSVSAIGGLLNERH